MTTEKLYEADAYLRAFTATVTDCVPARGGWAVTLDRSAFYPEGGGQPGDSGTLGGVRVLDTHSADGATVHLCDGPLSVGQTVAGEIDWAARFDRMQQHSGEHIVSGLICAAKGCSNVGFHMGAETVVIDFDALLSPAELEAIELAANRVIWENRPFLVTYPDAAALAALDYRSKKALSGDVRIVECPGADRCACCGTHVRTAGEIGQVRLISMKPFRSGVRIEMLAGERAYRWSRAVSEQNARVSVLLSAKPTETAAAAERLQHALSDARYRLVGLENRLFAQQAAALAGQSEALIFSEPLAPDALRRFCELASEQVPGRFAVFAGDDAQGWSYAMHLPGLDARAFTAGLNAALSGRGGGRDGFVQGSVRATQAEIAAFFAGLT